MKGANGVREGSRIRSSSPYNWKFAPFLRNFYGACALVDVLQLFGIFLQLLGLTKHPWTPKCSLFFFNSLAKGVNTVCRWTFRKSNLFPWSSAGLTVCGTMPCVQKVCICSNCHGPLWACVQWQHLTVFILRPPKLSSYLQGKCTQSRFYLDRRSMWGSVWHAFTCASCVLLPGAARFLAKCAGEKSEASCCASSLKAVQAILTIVERGEICECFVIGTA